MFSIVKLASFNLVGFALGISLLIVYIWSGMGQDSRSGLISGRRTTSLAESLLKSKLQQSASSPDHSCRRTKFVNNPRILPPRGKGYSSHVCFGGETGDGFNLRYKAKYENTRWSERTCVLRNIAVIHGELLYVRDPASHVFFDYVNGKPNYNLDDVPRLFSRLYNVRLKIVNSSPVVNKSSGNTAYFFALSAMKHQVKSESLVASLFNSMASSELLSLGNKIVFSTPGEKTTYKDSELVGDAVVFDSLENSLLAYIVLTPFSRLGGIPHFDSPAHFSRFKTRSLALLGLDFPPPQSKPVVGLAQNAFLNQDEVLRHLASRVEVVELDAGRVSVKELVESFSRLDAFVYSSNAFSFLLPVFLRRRATIVSYELCAPGRPKVNESESPIGYLDPGGGGVLCIRADNGYWDQVPYLIPLYSVPDSVEQLQLVGRSKQAIENYAYVIDPKSLDTVVDKLIFGISPAPHDLT